MIALCLVAAMAGPGAMAQTPASPATAVQAPDNDYAVFRALSEPFGVIDFITYSYTYGFARADREAGRTDPAHAAIRTAFARNMNAQRDGVIDVVMRHAFPAFSHDEIVRLKTVVACPCFARVQAATLGALRTGGDIEAEGTKVLMNDPDYQALAPADRELMGRFIAEISKGMIAAVPQINPIALATMAQLDGSSGARRH